MFIKQRWGHFVRFVTIFLTLLFIIFNYSPANAKILGQRYRKLFSSNNIVFYNPEEQDAASCPDGSTGSPTTETIIVGDDNGSIILGFLIQNGYTKTAAAAIAGNFMVESGLNPRKLQGGAIVEENFVAYDTGGKTFNGGFGLAQWTSAGRVQKLQDYANSRGMNVATLSAQLGFALQELTGGYASSSSPGAINNLSLEEATFMVRRYYEGPGAMIWTTNNGKYYNDYVPNNLSELSQSRTPGAYGEFSKAFNAAQSLLGITPTAPILTENKVEVCLPEEKDINNLIFYSQSDPKWGNLNYGLEGINGNDRNSISASGCGPTSFAVIATNLLHKSITPDQTADIAGRAGMHAASGSSHDITSVLGRHYGLKVIKIPGTISSINQYLNQGYMIHTSGKGAAPFTANGHYIAIVKNLPDGQWLVADSSKRGPSGQYSPQQVLSGMNTDNVWAVGI